jgi:phosphoglycolate phosphatase-like HAD superfamily hydrolase
MRSRWKAVSLTKPPEAGTALWWALISFRAEHPFLFSPNLSARKLEVWRRGEDMMRRYPQALPVQILRVGRKGDLMRKIARREGGEKMGTIPAAWANKPAPAKPTPIAKLLDPDNVLIDRKGKVYQAAYEAHDAVLTTLGFEDSKDADAAGWIRVSSHRMLATRKPSKAQVHALVDLNRRPSDVDLFDPRTGRMIEGNGMDQHEAVNDLTAVLLDPPQGGWTTARLAEEVGLTDDEVCAAVMDCRAYLAEAHAKLTFLTPADRTEAARKLKAAGLTFMLHQNGLSIEVLQSDRDAAAKAVKGLSHRAESLDEVRTDVTPGGFKVALTYSPKEVADLSAKLPKKKRGISPLTRPN